MRPLLIALILASSAVFANGFAEKSPRLLVHLLDYIGGDYPGAVQKGKVISEQEYSEMKEFTEKVVELGHTLPETKNIASVQEDLKKLEHLVLTKGPASEVAKQSADTKWKIIGMTGIALAPTVTASREAD